MSSTGETDSTRSNIKDSTSYLLYRLREARLWPARTRHHTNDQWSFRWYADNDDDRYIQMTDSLYSDDFVLLYRDSLLREVEAVVLTDPQQIVSWIASKLARLSVNRSPNGIPKVSFLAK
jgi:hypothetical protein